MTDFEGSRNIKCPDCGRWFNTAEGPQCDCDPRFREEDICGFCGLPGADKIPHPMRWPGEESAGTNLVHADCEREECQRAYTELSDLERQSFLLSIH